MIDSGSLMNSSVTALGPFPGLMSLSLSWAQGVNVAATVPGPWIAPAPACQVPVTRCAVLKAAPPQPSWRMLVGLWLSTAPCATLPLSSLTTNFRKQGGLDQFHSVTVPFSVRILSSKPAAPWCADSGAEY